MELEAFILKLKMLACITQASTALFKQLAAKAADLAENLPDGAAMIVVAARVARKEEHLADLLIRICLARTV